MVPIIGVGPIEALSAVLVPLDLHVRDMIRIFIIFIIIFL